MTIEGTNKLLDNLRKIPKSFLRQAKRIIDINARVLQGYVRTEKMTGGTTPSRLKVRSGRLRASVIPLKTEVKEDRVEGGISFGTIYARVHVGPRGQITTIRPKKGEYLTIPFLQEYVTKTGKVRKPPAVLSRRTSRKFVTFRKVKEVRVPARIHPVDLIAWIRPKVITDFKEAGIEVK